MTPSYDFATKLASLMYFRPGEKRKGLRMWTTELEARGWSKKKTSLAAGMETWFGAYAEAFYARKVAKRVAPLAQVPLVVRFVFSLFRFCFC